MPANASEVDLYLVDFVSLLVQEGCAILYHFESFHSQKSQTFLLLSGNLKPMTLCRRNRNFLKEIFGLGFSFTHDLGSETVATDGVNTPEMSTNKSFIC